MLTITLLCFVVGVLLSVVVCQRREYRRLRRDADSIVLRYVKVAERYEGLVCELTEPYGGVLSGLEEVNDLSVCLSCLPDTERMQAQAALARLDDWLCLLLHQVADRYRLTEADRRRWLSDVNGGEGRE